MKTGLYSYLNTALKIDLLKGSKKVICEQAIDAYVQGGTLEDMYKPFDIFNTFEDFSATVIEAENQYKLDNTATITGDALIEPKVEPVVEEPVAEVVEEPVIVEEPVVVVAPEFVAKYKKRGINVVEEGLISDFWEDEQNNFHQLLFINKDEDKYTLCKQTLVDFRQKNKLFVATGEFERCEAVCLSMLIKSELNYLYITEDHKQETFKLNQDEASA